MRDDKWHNYLPLCHRFNFVCPTGLIKPDELPNEIGLIYYNPDKQTLQTKRKAFHQSIELPTNLLYYLILSRLDDDRHPFFTGKREALEAWVSEKGTKHDLARGVNQKIHKQFDDADRRIKKAEELAAQYQKDHDDVESVVKKLKEAGYNPWRGNWVHKIEEALEATYPPDVMSGLRLLEEGARKIREAMTTKKESS